MPRDGGDMNRSGAAATKSSQIRAEFAAHGAEDKQFTALRRDLDATGGEEAGPPGTSISLSGGYQQHGTGTGQGQWDRQILNGPCVESTRQSQTAQSGDRENGRADQRID